MIPRNHALFQQCIPQHIHTHVHTIHTYISSAFRKLKFNFTASSESSFLQKELQICKEAIASSAPAFLHVLVNSHKAI